MLHLSRKTGEQIRVNGNVTVTVRRIGRHRVILTVDAPREVPVVRVEIEKPREAKT